MNLYENTGKKYICTKDNKRDYCMKIFDFYFQNKRKMSQNIDYPNNRFFPKMQQKNFQLNIN